MRLGRQHLLVDCHPNREPNIFKVALSSANNLFCSREYFSRLVRSDIARWDAKIAPLVRQGRSLYHIKRSFGEADSLQPLRTLDSYVEKRAFPSICGVDLLRKVKYKKRRTNVDKRQARGDRRWAASASNTLKP